MWITMWKACIPIVSDVNNSVENFKTYLHQKIFFVDNQDINSLLTDFSHMYVDILCRCSVSKVCNFFLKHFFNKRFFCL